MNELAQEIVVCGDITKLAHPKDLNEQVKLLAWIYYNVLLLKIGNKFQTKKSEVAKYFGISEQTLGRYLKSFSSSGMLKYKYSGTYYINPEYLFCGSKEEYAREIELYKLFPSDI